ncbi:hypothetical protein CQJ94_12345 [Glycomyces fuscus]|nr:hypothetical protein CQJ94_12345 [Glycomyces fuscus]
MNRDLIPRALNGTVLTRATAGVASVALAAALTSCSFSVGELEPVGEGEPAPAASAEPEATDSAGQAAGGGDGGEEAADTGDAGGELPVDPSEAVAWDEETFWLSGSGDALYRLDWTPSADSALQLTHSGSSNFIVAPYDADGTRLGSIVNEIGAYEGESLLEEAAILGGAAEIAFVHVQADGAWTLTR